MRRSIGTTSRTFSFPSRGRISLVVALGQHGGDGRSAIGLRWHRGIAQVSERFEGQGTLLTFKAAIVLGVVVAGRTSTIEPRSQAQDEEPMSIRCIPPKSKRAFRPTIDDLEGRRLMSSAMVPRGPTPGDINAPSAPAIAAFNDKIYMASVNGYQGVPFEIQSSSDGGLTFGNKVDLLEKTESSPALTAFDGRLYTAWRGDNSAHQVNVESSSNGVDFGNKVLFSENTIGSPALTVFDGRLYVAWTGTDHHLNVESSSNGVNFGNKVTVPESSGAGPALTAFGAVLEIAWAGTDKGHHLNVESSSNGVNFGNKVTLRESNSAPDAGRTARSGAGQLQRRSLHRLEGDR